MKVLVSLSAFALLAVTGCAHTMMRGSVVMKHNEKEAHICMGDGEVKVGDTLSVFKSECTSVGKTLTCKKVRLGDGKVTELVNEHYSVMEYTGTAPLQEGFIVEKNK